MGGSTGVAGDFKGSGAKDLWLARGRFVAGVLAVNLGWSMCVGFYKTVRYSGSEHRLREGQLLRVWDFASGNVFAPTECHYFDSEYQHNPSLDSKGHLFFGEVERDTLVMINDDRNRPNVKHMGDGFANLDRRWVSVTFLSGLLSGRMGYVERYKLSPLENG